MIHDWIFDDNLPAFLTTIGWIIGCELDNEERADITSGVAESDGDHDKWFQYELKGDSPARLELACDHGCGVVQVRIEVPQALEERVKLAIQIFNEYHVTRTPR
jgi:hypothetical protein